MKALRTAVWALLLPLCLAAPALAEGAQEQRPDLPPLGADSGLVGIFIILFVVMTGVVVWYFRQRRK